MFKNYFLLTLRNLKKHSFFSMINIASLAIGMAAFILIIFYIQFECSYDRFHQKADSIYRVESRFLIGDETKMQYATVSNGYMPAMKAELPEIEDYARVWLWDLEKVVQFEDQKFKEPNVYFVDPSFLTIFSFAMIEGDPETALTEPNSVVITRSAARKYFGAADPLGQMIKISTPEGHDLCTVTGVLEDPPRNSHLQFNFLISWKTMLARKPYQENFWYQHSAYGFVLLKQDANPHDIEMKFPAISKEHKTRNDLKEYTWGVELIPLRNIHLKPLLSCEREIKGNRIGVYALLAAGIFVLLIAWINFVNLTTAKSIERAREVGIRKVIGANRRQLMKQFIFESVVINLLALILAVGIFELARPSFSNISGIPNPGYLLSPELFLLLSGIFLLGVLLSGLYPAMLLSSHRPINVLTGKFGSVSQNISLRKSLVIFQFTAMIILLSVVFIFYRQIRYMHSQNLGIETEQILVLKTPVDTDHSSENIEAFRSEALSHPSILNVSGSSSVPGKEVGMHLANRLYSEEPEHNKLYEMLRTDQHFIDTYELKLKYGRGFSEKYPTDNDALVINESAARYLGFADPKEALNQEIHLEVSRKAFTVIGIIEDYHHQSLKEDFTPVMLFIAGEYGWIQKQYYSLKFKPQQAGEVIAFVRDIWARTFPNSAFDYFILDDFYNAQYQADIRFEKVLTLFTGLAIFIALLGLFGLIVLASEQRIKEIGIRKILGATTANLTLLFAREYSISILLSGFIALPLSGLISHRILTDFAFRIDLNHYIWVFPSAAIIALMIALLTITIQVIRVSGINPAKSLRHE